MGRTTRWEQGEHGYAALFARLVAAGEDVDGEARLADVLLPREGRVLDAGSGMGRVAAALQARGHRVVGVDKDESLLAQSRRTYPDLPVVAADLTDLTPELLDQSGHPGSYDLVVCVGNVLVYLAEDSATEVLTRFHDLLATDGRVLVGFHPAHSESSLPYPDERFTADVEAAGLVVDHQFGAYDLTPGDGVYGVWVLSARARRGAPAPRA